LLFLWSDLGEKRERNFKKMSKIKEPLLLSLDRPYIVPSGRLSLLCALPLAKGRRFSLSLSLSARTEATEREEEKEITFGGRFSAPKFSKCVHRKDDDDGHAYFFSQKEGTRKIKTGTERKKRARATCKENLFFCAQKKRVAWAFISAIRTFFVRHFERNF
jgi:hypothetical protein